MVTKANTETALTTNVLSDDDYTSILRSLGLIEESSASDYPERAKVDGATIFLGDEMYVGNPKTDKPNMRVRILGLPNEYQGLYIPSQLAAVIGRPDAADKYCKSHFDVETEKREYAVDGTNCRACPISPFTKKDNLPTYIDSDGRAQTRKCQWRAEIHFQVLDDSGAISDPTTWALDLSTTSIIEFKGTGREATKGSVSDLNFVQKLVRLGASLTPKNPNEGVGKALLAYRLGGVIADVRQVQAKSPDGSRSWYVTSFTPVDIIEVEEEPAAALPAGDPAAIDPDDLPF